MNRNANGRQDADAPRRKPPVDDLQETDDATSGTPRGGGEVEIPGSSGSSGTIKVTG